MPKRIRSNIARNFINSYTAVGISLSELFALHKPRGDFILKIDIEGAEFSIIDDISHAVDKEGTNLLLSLHPENIVASDGSGRSANESHQRSVIAESVEKLPRRSNYYWKMKDWHIGNKGDLTQAAQERGESIRSIIITDLDVASSLN